MNDQPDASCAGMTPFTDPEDDPLTEQIIGGYHTVRRRLKYGLPESVYRNALAIECRKVGLKVRREVTYGVDYEGAIIGQLRVDLLVNDSVIVEAKHVARLIQAHRDQLYGYLCISGLRLGLLLNFGPSVDIRRVERWG